MGEQGSQASTNPKCSYQEAQTGMWMECVSETAAAEKGMPSAQRSTKKRLLQLQRSGILWGREDRSEFNIQAEFEESMRQQARNVPLAPKGTQVPEIEERIFDSGLKKLSAARLQLNFDDADQHPVWTSLCQLGNRAFSNFGKNANCKNQ